MSNDTNAVTEAILREEDKVDGVVDFDKLGKVGIFGFVRFVAHAHATVADHAVILTIDTFGFGGVFHGASNAINIGGGIAGESFGIIVVQGFGFSFFRGNVFVGKEVEKFEISRYDELGDYEGMLGDGQANHRPDILGIRKSVADFDGPGCGEAKFGSVEFANALSFGFVSVDGEQVGIIKVQFYHHH